MLLSKETVKTFLLYFTLIGVIILSINTFILVQNQNRVLYNQENRDIPVVGDINSRVSNIEQILLSYQMNNNNNSSQ